MAILFVRWGVEDYIESLGGNVKIEFSLTVAWLVISTVFSRCLSGKSSRNNIPDQCWSGQTWFFNFPPPPQQTQYALFGAFLISVR